MKKNDVYAIGNVLVDFEFEIDKALLAKTGLAKGQMTLIDLERRDELLQHVADLSLRRTGGGSAGNTAVAIAQFGGSSFLSCRLGNDENGRFYLDDLKENGVKHNLAKLPESGTTGTCFVFVTPDAERTMATYLGATATLDSTSLVANEIEHSLLYFMEGYLSASPTGLQAALDGRKISKAAGVKLALTLSDVSMITFCKPGLVDMVGANDLDYLFCNEEEAIAWTGLSDFHAIVTQMKQMAKVVCITRGKQGCTILHDNNEITVDSYPVKAVDTNGAGDMFSGAFLYAIHHGFDILNAVKLANFAASKVVSQHGNRLSTSLIKTLLQQHQAL